MNAIEQELQKVTGVKFKAGEKRTKYLDRISIEADKLSDAKYDALSEGARAWLDASAEEYKKATARGKDPLIEDFGDAGAEVEPQTKPAKAPKVAKKAAEEEDDEDVEIDDAGNFASVKPQGLSVEDHDPEDDEEDVAKTKKGKTAPKKAAKTVKAKAPAKVKEAKAAKPTKAAKANGTAKKSNGEIRAGSKNEKLLNLISKPGGATLKEALKATGWKECRSTMRILAARVGKEVKVIKQEGKDTRYAVV